MIVDIENLNSKNDKIFFGEYSGFQRYDKPAFPTATKLEETMRGSFWNPAEISMRSDAVKFHDMPKSVQDVMCSIWFYQTLMDSAQNRGLEETISSYITNPEWECTFKTWGYFEMIHSISYSHIIRGIFVDSVDVFEKNFSNQQIIDRVSHEIQKYNNEVNLEPEDTIEGRKSILELILMIYALEGIKFYASFLLTYLINDKFSAIPGAARIIKLINFDEDLHTHGSVVLLNDLKKDPSFVEIIQSEWFAKTSKNTFERVKEDEKSFADYLVEQGGIDLPVSRSRVHEFLDYYVERRLADIGVLQETDIREKPPLVEWFENYKDLNKENIALQESDMSVYNIGTMVNDL